ncbi:hypothetical protein KEM55_006768 [Ascosphaera atra]|nr:hypothetical protein KEM55_006768 [Ascosphaera atra]
MAACESFNLDAQVEAAIPTFEPSYEDVDRLISVVDRAITGTTGHQDGDDTAMATPPGLHDPQEASSFEPEPPLLSLLDFHPHYSRDLGEWPKDCDSLAATHMTVSEIARGRHFKTARHSSLQQRAQAMSQHKLKARSIQDTEAQLSQLVEQGELHHLPQGGGRIQLSISQHSSLVFSSSLLAVISLYHLRAVSFHHIKHTYLSIFVVSASQQSHSPHRLAVRY